MQWGRYRIAAYLAVPLGCAIGVFIASLLIGGRPYADMPGEMHLLWHTVIVGVCFGAPTAFAAMLGGFLAMYTFDCELQADPAHRRRAGTLGAGSGALVAWMLFGCGLAASKGSIWPILTMAAIGAIAACAAAVIARFAIWESDRLSAIPGLARVPAPRGRASEVRAAP